MKRTMKRIVSLLLSFLFLGSVVAYAYGPLHGLVISRRLPSEDATGIYNGKTVKVNVNNLTDAATAQMKIEFEELAETDSEALDEVTLKIINEKLVEAPEYCTYTNPHAVCRKWIMSRAQGADAWATWPSVRIVAESYPVIVTLPVEDHESVIALLLHVDGEWYVPEEEKPFTLDDGTGVIRFVLSAPAHLTILRPRGLIYSPERMRHE